MPQITAMETMQKFLGDGNTGFLKKILLIALS